MITCYQLCRKFTYSFQDCNSLIPHESLAVLTLHILVNTCQSWFIVTHKYIISFIQIKSRFLKEVLAKNTLLLYNHIKTIKGSIMGKNDSISFCSRRHVDRRRVKDRRSILKQGYLGHNPERRVNKIKRRMTGDRRRMLAEVIYTFWKEAP